MHSLDELVRTYASQDPDGRRYTLTLVEDVAPGADVFPRIPFLAERVAQESGTVRDQAIASFLALLPVRRLAGWATVRVPPGPVPILTPSDVRFDPQMPALVQVALALGADGTYVTALEDLVSHVADPFPLTIGLALRPACQSRLAGFLGACAATHPTLALALCPMYGRPGRKLLEDLAAVAQPAARVSLLRALPRHPERHWTVAFRQIAQDLSSWDEVHAAAALRRIGTPKALGEAQELAPRLTHPVARLEVFRLLARIGHSSAHELARSLLAIDAEPVLAAVLEELLAHGMVDSSLASASTPMASAGACAVKALALGVQSMAGDTAARGELEAMARDSDERSREAACRALAHISDRRSFAHLERIALEDSSVLVACTALRGLRSARAVDGQRALQAAIGRGGPLAFAATEVLVWRATVDPAWVLGVLGPSLSSGPGLLALGVASAVSGSREALAHISQVLTSDDPDTVRWATEALYPLGHAIPRKLLFTPLSAESPVLRACGAVALTLSGDHRGVRLLRGLFQSQSTALPAAHALLDLAAILPHVRGWPLFGSVAELVPQEGPRFGLAAAGRSKSGRLIALPALTGALIPGQPQSTGAPPGPAAPQPTHAPPATAVALATPTPPPAPVPPSPAPPPAHAPATGARATGAASAVLRSQAILADRSPASSAAIPRPHPPAPERPHAPSAARSLAVAISQAGRGPTLLAGPSLLGRVVVGALALGAMAAPAVVFLRGRDPSRPAAAMSAAPVLSITSPGLFVSEAIGAVMARGTSPPRIVVRGDRMAAGDLASTTPTGRLSIRSQRGTHIAMGPRSRIALRLEPSGVSGAFVLDGVSGEVNVDWRERESMRLEFERGALEGDTIGLGIKDGQLKVFSGQGTWADPRGEKRALQSGSDVEL